MPRPRQPIDVHQQAEQVLERERSEGIPWKLQRLQAIRLAMEGRESYQRIAGIVRTTSASLCQWIGWFRQGGIDELLGHANGAKGGKAPRFDPPQWERFRAELAKGRWRTARDAQHWLKEELGLVIARKEVYRHLGKLGARLKVGRRSHIKKDPAATEAFKTGGLDAKLAALALAPRTPVRVWVLDEARFGLHTEHRRMWGLPGVRVIVPHQQKYEWDYTYGAVEVSRAGSVFCFQSTVHLEASGKFIDQIVAHDPAAIHVIIQDGAGFHLPENDPRLPANVRIITLPAYSPELNPVEKLWDHLKDEICHRVFATVEELRKALTGWLKEFWSDGTRALSLIGHGWLLASVNAGVKC
jgi:transposase